VDKWCIFHPGFFIHKELTGRGLLAQNLSDRKTGYKQLIYIGLVKLSTGNCLLNNNNKNYIFNIY